MARTPDNPPSTTDDAHPASDRLHELTWAMLDEQINDTEFAELESLLTADPQAREAYFRLVQMHVDLKLHFDKSKKESPLKTPVLGFLAEGMPQLGTPQVGDATT